jgi:DNA-binding MarR family transcriptional regulator
MAADPASRGVVAVQRTQLLIGQLGRRITAVASAAGAAGVTENRDVQVLLTLLLEGRCTPGRLTGAAGLTTGGMTALLDRLTRAGLLRRERDPEATDRRSLDVTLTPAGERAARVLATATRDALASRPPEVEDVLATLRIRPDPEARPLDVEASARLMLELADRSVEHTGEVAAAATAAGIRGLEVLPGRRAYSVCCLVDLYGPQSPGAIAAHVERSAATATRLVLSLERVGLIRRVAADPPRRGQAYDVDLTAAGRRLARVIDGPTPALRALGRAVAAGVPAEG